MEIFMKGIFTWAKNTVKGIKLYLMKSILAILKITKEQVYKNELR
jgi:hypothetical protein